MTVLEVVGMNVPRYKNENVIHVYLELTDIPRPSNQLYLPTVYICNEIMYS